jgi:phosphatidate cytidylyltransferase
MNNTVTRTISGIGFLAVVLGGLLVNQYLYAALFLLMMGTMLYEFYRMTMGQAYRYSQILAILLGITAFSLVFSVFAFSLDIRFLSINAILLLAIMITSLFAKDKTDFKSYGFIYTGLLYIAVPLTLSNFIMFDKAGGFSGLMMLSFFCIIWASDVGAYCFGLLFGKNGKKLFPTVSPKKSWAGFWGGLLLALVTGGILYWTHLLDFPLLHCLILAAIMNVTGVFGDLFESQWKRVCDIKDSGNLIPGHGGMLDRFDSALFAIPAGVIYLVIIGLL